MKNILFFGDSNTWGYIPLSGERYTCDERYVGLLRKRFPDYNFIEEAMNGRTTCYDDGSRPGRNGFAYLLPSLFSHSPLDLIVIMLGTNDFKARFSATPQETKRGVEQMIKLIKSPLMYAGKPDTKILLVTPVGMGDVEKGPFAGVFPEGSKKKIAELNKEYEALSKQYGIYHMDASVVASAQDSKTPDYIHIDKTGHQKLADAFEKKLKEIEF